MLENFATVFAWIFVGFYLVGFSGLMYECAKTGRKPTVNVTPFIVFLVAVSWLLTKAFY